MRRLHRTQCAAIRSVRILGLGLVTLLVGLAANAEDGCQSAICARVESEELIRITAPGVFETTLTVQEGFAGDFYNLQRDPDRTRDLTPKDPENGLLWTKVAKPRTTSGGPSWYANQADEIDILEASGARVRVRHSGYHHKYGLPGAESSWLNLPFEQTFTVYSSGHVFIDYAFPVNFDVGLHEFTFILKTTREWSQHPDALHAGEARCVGQNGDDKPTGSTKTAFALTTSDGPSYFQDFLLVMDQGNYRAAYWNEGFFPSSGMRGDFRCSMDISSRFPAGTCTNCQRMVAPPVKRFSAMLGFFEDVNDESRALLFANDFRNPDSQFSVLEGLRISNDAGDYNEDGYNEAEGAYVVDRSGADRVAFTLHANQPRMYPTFKIKNWNDLDPREVRANDVPLIGGVDYDASVQGATLILQLRQEWYEPVDVVIEPPGLGIPIPVVPLHGVAILAASLAVLGAQLVRKRRFS